MAAPERKIPRREMLINYLVKPAKVGVAVVAVGAVGQVGRMFGAGEERGKHLSPGELSPEQEEKLRTRNYFIHNPEGETIARLRKAGMDIPAFPLVVSEGQPDPETVPSKRKWFAVRPGFYLPNEGDTTPESTTPKELSSLVSRESSDMRLTDSGFQAVTPEAVELLGLENAHLLRTGETLFTESGFVLTATKVGNDAIAIGRATLRAPLSFVIVDVSTSNPTPPTVELRAAGIVGAK